VTGVLSATSVVVTSADNAPGTNIGEFKAQDGLQGVGIGFNTVRATGGNGDVDLNLTPKGTGVVKVNGPLTVTGAVNVPGGSITGPMLRADPIGCVTVQKAVTGAGVQQAFVLLRDFGFGTSHTRTGGGCRCQSDTGNQVMVFNNPDPNFDDAWSCICKDTSSSAVTTAFVIGCRLR
jgi:hypothetical protein